MPLKCAVAPYFEQKHVLTSFVTLTFVDFDTFNFTLSLRLSLTDEFEISK